MNPVTIDCTFVPASHTLGFEFLANSSVFAQVKSFAVLKSRSSS